VAAGEVRLIRIALVEDDLVLRDRILVPHLRRAGFGVQPMSLAAELRNHLATAAVDIAVLDVGLPDGDGFSLSRDCRAAFPDMGILMLTGRQQAEDVVEGLSGGADAYLTKPVSVEVLIATLNSLGRRMGIGAAPASAQPWRLSGGDWTLRSPQGVRIGLTATERRFLAVLFHHAGCVVSRETLVAAMTDGANDYDPHRMDSLIHRLRRKIAVSTAERLPLNPVPGEGYMLVADDN
jgi:DNA-binding response OmpR family regulator